MTDRLTSMSTRRGLLRTTGGLTVVGLAGCIGSASPSSSGGDDAPSTTAVTEETHSDEDHETTTATETERDDPDHSHHSGHHHEDVPDEPASSATVKMITKDGGYHFNPHVVWIEEGGTVTFVNESGSHSATAYAPVNDKPQRIPENGTAFDTGLLTDEGVSHEITIETPGIYDYYCIPHETPGMIGSIIVGKPDPHDQPGLTEPEALPEETHEKVHRLNKVVNEALDHSHGGETETAETETADHHTSTETEHHHEETETESHHDGTESDHHSD